MNEILISSIIGASGVVIGVILSSIIENIKINKIRNQQIDDRLFNIRQSIIHKRSTSLEKFVKVMIRNNHILFSALTTDVNKEKLSEVIKKTNDGNKNSMFIENIADAAVMDFPGLAQTFEAMQSHYSFLISCAEKIQITDSISEIEQIRLEVKKVGPRIELAMQCLEIIDKAQISCNYLHYKIKNEKLDFVKRYKDE
jgi:hypothetical protein